MIPAKHTPFFQSGAGVVTLLLLGALASAFFGFIFKYMPDRWEENREQARNQRELLMDIKREVMPGDGRKSLVDRVNSVEQTLADLVSEVENIMHDLRRRDNDRQTV